MDELTREEAFTHAVGLRDVMATAWVECLTDVGMSTWAKALLTRTRKDTDSSDYLYVLAQVGDAALARRLLSSSVRDRPHDTLLNEVMAPEVRAVLAMRAGRPREAVAALLPARPHGNDAVMAPYLLGQAYLAAKDGARAAGAFRTAIDNRAEHPIDSLLPLARLGLARAERLQGDIADSRRDYQAFLALWKDADEDVPVLKAARAELAGL
jgi:predicted Zn-dependent protease